MPFSTYYANFVCDAKTSLTLSLHTANPTDTGLVAEVVGGSYARQAVTMGAASSKAYSNSTAASFTSMPAVSVTHAAMWDGSSNCIWYGPLSATKAVGAGETVTFDVGDITVTIS